MAREMTASEIKELLSYKEEDFTAQKLRDLFAVRGSQIEPRFYGNETFTLLPGFLYNDKAVKTTIFRYIFNLVAIPRGYLQKYGILNKPFTTKVIEALEETLGNMLLNDEIYPIDYINYLNKGEFIGMGMAYYVLPSMNYEINKPIDKVIKRRDELFVEYKDEIEAGDPNVAEKIEKELLGMAEKELVDSKNPSYDFYASKEFKFANNYKKSSILGGAFIHPSTKKITISKANYMDGITVQDYPMFSNLVVAGGYARGVSTQDGGYETKKLNSAMQAVMLDDKDSDCGTKLTITIKLEASYKNLFLYRYIVDNGKLVMLDDNNIGNYVGKDIQLRSPLTCKGNHVCSKCAGDLFYKLGMPNAGLLTSTFSGTLMNKSMKTIHDASIKFTKIDFDKYIKER